MKKKVFSLMMMCVLAMFGMVNAQTTLVINEGTETSTVLPVDGFHVDRYVKSEFVIPAASLTDMVDGEINELTFAVSVWASKAWDDCNIQVFVKEVASTTLTDFEGMAGATVVYEGGLDATTAEMTVPFAAPYTYGGGNLLVGFYNTVKGLNISQALFSGVSATGAGVSGYSLTSLDDVVATAEDFLPQMTFGYMPYVPPTPPTPTPVPYEEGLHVTYNGVLDAINLGYRPGPVNTPNYSGSIWMAPRTFYMYNNSDEDYSVSVLDFTPSDSLFLIVDAELPFEVPADSAELVPLQVTMVPDVAGTIERQFVAIYENSRLAKVWPITAEVYTPECPDVYELALNVSNFPFVHVPSTLTTLHDDYTLPYPLVQDGYDAVYKMTFEEDKLFNAYVSAGANGKVVLYTEDFYYDTYGIPGPSTENYYNGPQAGGSTAAQPFEALIGDESTTTSMTYFPFHTLWNYSLAENLFLASELEDAGVNSTPMTSLSWYVKSTTCTTPQNNISIWMANVGDEALTTASHTITGMTLVYSGSNILPVADEWNEFVFNQGTFSWDGHSNVLILCQRSNGSWQGSVNWQTHNPGFVATSYAYNDNNPYDVTVSNSMSTSSTGRPNIIMKADGREYLVGGSVEISDMTVRGEEGGTSYYLVASSTDPDFEVTIDATTLPCPEQASQPVPADDADGLEPNAVELKWNLGDYTTGWRLIFGTTYYPDPNHPQTIMYPEDGSYTTELRQSYTVRNLWNNTNYFWRIDECNSGCETLGEIWGFTTNLNIPQNLRAEDQTIFEGEDVVLHWDPVVDRTYRWYFIYQDGVKIGETQVNNINATTYTVSGLTYNMTGYVFNVTAVYDEGESDFSNPVDVKVSGKGTISGWVYEMDYDIPIPGATVLFEGIDEFTVGQTFTATTDANGYYQVDVYAGGYNGYASKGGYQIATAPVCSNPVFVYYQTTTSPVNFILNETFNPVSEVIAQYYPDSTDIHAPYVKVYWSWNVMSQIIEDFETGDFSQFDWQLDPTYPWQITTYQPYEGTYCMKSGNQQVLSSTSTMQVTVNIPRDGIMSFFGKISSEQNWDYGYFYIDGVQKGSYTGSGSWGEKKFDITAGDHTFKWEYTEDYIISSGDDCFYVDYITFFKQPEPAQPGWHTYCESEFNNAVGSNVGQENWAYEYPASFLNNNYAGWNITKVSLFSDNMYMAVGGNYTCRIYVGGSQPAAGTMVSTITVDVPQGLNAWVDWDLTTPVSVSGTDPIWVVWTANTKLSSWPAGCCGDLNDLGTWWDGGNGWEHLTYGTWTMRQWFTNRDGRSVAVNADVAPVAVAPTMPSRLATPVKGAVENANTLCANANPTRIEKAEGNRFFNYFRVYRTNCYNDGPYTFENTQILACEVDDTLYIDVSWPDAAPGVYKWGVAAVYDGDRESEIVWSDAPTAQPVKLTEKARMTAVEDGVMPEKVAAQETPSVFRGEDAYATAIYTTNTIWSDGAGYYTFNTDNMADVTYLATSGNSNRGGDYAADGYFYAWDSYGYLNIINPATGNCLGWRYLGYTMVAMAYNYADATMYAIDNSGTYGDYSQLVTVSLDAATFGEVVPVGDLGTSIMTLAIDLHGQAYGIEYGTGNLYKIDITTAAKSLVGNTGLSVQYVQCMNFDHSSLHIGHVEDLYWYQLDGNVNSGLYKVNVLNAEVELVQANTGEVVNFFVPGVYQPIINGTEPIQEPRESVIVWSNCLDKDMYLDNVTVTVLLNSADSPEGTTVAFRNLDDFEQELYPMPTVTLDATGFMPLSNFRKGDYEVTVTLDGYETIVDYVSIWDATDLRYVMTEILYPIDNLYVSYTGWAMWDGQGTVPGGGGGTGDTFSVNFDDSQMPAGWTTIDGGTPSGYGWQIGSTKLGSTGNGHNGSADLVLSQSYDNNYGVVYPDNWLISPAVNLGNSSQFSLWACGQDANYAAEHFGVFVSTTGTNPSDFTMVGEWTLTAKGDRYEGNRGERAQGNWYQKTVDLSAYAGSARYIAVRHFNCSDMFYLDVDDLELSNGRSDERHLEYYKVMCTSIDGQPIFNANTPADRPFCQVETAYLVEGEQYLCKVAAVYSTGMSAWKEYVWEYRSCENYDGTVNGITVEGTTVSWDYPAGGGGGGGGTGDTFTVDFDNSQIPSGWTLIDGGTPSGYGWQIGSTKLGSTGNGHNGSADLVLSQSYDNNYGVVYPDNWLISPAVNLGNNSQFSLWACGQDANYAAEHFGVFVSTTGTNPSDFTMVGEWTLTAKGDRYEGNRGERTQGTWYQKTVDLGAYAGSARYIAVRHFNCSDMFYLDVDDLELSNGSKGRAAFEFFNGHVTDPGAMANGADASWIKGSQTTWGPNVNNGGGYKLADSFTLTEATTITDIEVYGYQTGSSSTSTFTGLYAQIYNGAPNAGSAIWGSESTNIMTSTAFTNCYRGSDGETNATTRPIMSITASGLNIQLEAGTYYLVYSLAGSGSSGPWGAPHCEPGIGNTGNGMQYTSSGWTNLTDSGAGTTYGCSMKITGTTSGSGPIPGETECIGAMVFLNGEWEAFVPAPTNSYTYEESGIYCVRMVYDGAMNGEYYSMSCEECEGFIPGVCLPGDPISGEYVYHHNDDFGALIHWGENTPPPTPVEEWLYYDNGTYSTSIGAGGSDVYWGMMVPASSLTPYVGTSLTKVALYENSYNTSTVTVNIFLGGTAAPATLVSTMDYSPVGGNAFHEVTLNTPVAIDGTQNLWVTFKEYGTYPCNASDDTGEANGRWISLDGISWEDVAGYGLNYTWMVRGFVTNQAKAGEYMPLDFVGGGNGNVANLTHTEVVSIPADLSFMNNREIEIVEYKVYRSTDEVNYAHIGTVAAVPGQVYYEYYDQVAIGDYYYGVTAVYDDGCESDFAMNEAGTADHVLVHVTAIDESGKQVALYPNPTSGNVKIEAEGMNHITVVSVLGQVVYDADVNADEIELNMAQFNAGVYMVRIATETGVSTQRVTVVR